MVQTTLEEIQRQHEALLQNDEGLDGDGVPPVQSFLQQLAEAGAGLDRPEHRSHLRALIRYWSSFVYDKTGILPSVQLRPYEPDEVAAQPAIFQAPAPQERTAEHRCPNCGQRNPGSSAFCETCGAPLSLAAPAAPRVLGPYEIVDELGQGGFSRVYLGRDTRDGIQVAIKLFRRDRLRDDAVHLTLVDNERSVQGLRHPNILTIRDTGLVGGESYVVSEYVQEGSLATRLSAYFWRPTLGEILRIGRQIADGLQYLHENGLVHRDVKPGNILMDSVGHVYVADFGVAQAIGRVLSDSLVGTPEYMAPEAIREPQSVDGRTDLYGLGVILYELIAGKRPFEGTTAVDVMRAQMEYMPPRLDATMIVPAEVASVVAACLEKERELRPANAAAVRNTLDHLLAELSPETLDAHFAEFTSSPEERPHETMVGIHPQTTYESQPVPESDTGAYMPPNAADERPTVLAPARISGDHRTIYPPPPYPAPEPPTLIENGPLPLPLPVAVLIERRSGRLFGLQDRRTVLGRSTLCGVVVFDPSVSRQHALIVYTPGADAAPGSFELIDLAGAGGTLRNGDDVIRVPLSHNDVITIGRTEVIFKRLDD